MILPIAGFIWQSDARYWHWQGKKENPSWVEIVTTAEGRSGRLGGHFDRPDPDDSWIISNCIFAIPSVAKGAGYTSNLPKDQCGWQCSHAAMHVQ